MRQLYLIAIYLIMISSLASATTSNKTTFEAGQFIGSIDIGRPCKIAIQEPYDSTDLDGTNNTIYNIYCNDTIFIQLQIYDNGIYSLDPKSIRISLIEEGADKDTILINERKIDDKKGYAASGYIPKKDLKIYRAGYPISTQSACWIGTWKNDKADFLATLNSIHVEERKSRKKA